MRQMRKAVTLLIVVCVLCSTYANRVSAAETEISNVKENQTENETNAEESSNFKKDSLEDTDTGEEKELENSEDDIEKADTEEKRDEEEDIDSEEESNEVDNIPDEDEKIDEENIDGGADDTENDALAEEERDEFAEEIEQEEKIDSVEVIEEVDSILETISPQAVTIGEVSRIEWLTVLVDVFEISVAEDNYPDNYYSDVDTSSANYRTIMLATEFGLVDVEAGEAFRANDAATREFAAHTLNFCLGFMPNEEGNYTFNEVKSVIYADDIQVAIERGWLQLSNGNFLPDAPITSAEREMMLADAKNVLAYRQAEINYSNQYTFAEDVIDLTKVGVNVELTDADILTFQKCPVKLEAGKKYGLEFEGFPVVYKSITVTQSNDETVMQFEAVPIDEAFTAIDMQGSMNVDLATVQAYSDDIELHYIVGGTEAEEWEDGTKYDSLEEVGNQEISAVEAVREYTLSEKVLRDFNLAPGVKASVTCKVSDIKPDYDIKLSENKAHVGVDAKVIVNCNISANVMEAAGISPTLDLVRIPIACAGYFAVRLKMTLSGEATFSLAENISLGLYYEDGSFRLEKEYSKDSFTLQTHVEISAEVSAILGMTSSNIMKGELFAKFGAKNVLDSITYGDGKKPTTCAHHSAWLFASAGGFAEVKIGLESKSWGKTYQIYTEKNSPVRVSFHYEDGTAVSKCTRGTTYGPTGRKWGYYTSADSKYGYNGASQGIGANGEPYTIFEYTLDSANRATINKYQGNVSALSIPKTLDGYTVVKIGDSVFANNKLLRVVVIPDSVTEVGKQAFSNCVNISQVTLSKNIKYIGGGAFFDCDSLTSIEIPKSLENASADWNYKGPFGDCDGLKNVSFEKGTTKIVSSLFYSCTGIEEIEIPETVTVIGNGAFRNCNNLERVNISNSVTEIQGTAFNGCTKLKEIEIPDSVVEIGDVAFGNCINLSQVTLPKNIENIGGGAFFDCDSLTSIEIPKSLENAGADWNYKGPFGDCDGLKNVSFEKGTIKIVSNLFYSCTGIEEIEIPETVTVIGSGAFRNCNNLEKVNISNSVTEIQGTAFNGCTKLKEVEIPDSVVEIGDVAFGNCTNLSQVTLPKNIENIGGGAFFDCDSLTSIEIPKSLENAGADWNYKGPFGDCDGLKNVSFEKGTTKVVSSLFYSCTGIEEIEIPETVTVIENSSFRACENLKIVRISDSVKEIENCAFQDCVKLTDVKMSNSMVKLGNWVFSNCTNLPKIVLPDSIADMGTAVFAECSNLQEIILPKALTNIPRETFKNCSSLEKVNFPEGLKEIRSYAFYNTNLPEAKLPNSLCTIENYAFYNCDSLTKASVPDNVTTLGTYIFADCERLSDVSLGTGITVIPSYSFNLCPSLQKIVLPYRVATINSNAFTNCTALTEITIPRNVMSIADNVFSYPSRLTIYGVAGTYAETYANSIGATFVNQETKATEIKLSATELKLVKGKTAILNLSVTPSNFTDIVIWKSTDDKVVSVEDSGIVTAKAIGTATVKVIVGDLNAFCKITVTQPVTSIDLNKTSLSMEAWTTDKLTASVFPISAENKTIVWDTSDNKVASVDDTGLVTAHMKGSATITATAQDGSGVFENCIVTVLNNGYLCSSIGELESPHNYPVNCSDFWQYTKEGAESLYITFDERTKVEEDFDFLYLYDGQGKQIGKYTGTQLAGQVVEVLGDTVKIKLMSGDEGTAWGFKVTYIMGTGDVENDECLVTFDSQGGTMVSAAQVEKGKTVPRPTEPDRKGYEFLGWYLEGELYDFSRTVTKNMVLQAKWRYIVPEPDTTEPIPAEDMPEDGVIPSGLWIAGTKDQAYTGKAIKPEVHVYDGSRRLKEKTDYTISYRNNIKANDASNVKKAPTITVRGKGNYGGSATATFKINPINLNEESVSITLDVLAYNKKVQKKTPIVTFLGKKMTLKRDYTIIYPASANGSYQEVGTYPIQVIGVGNFTGTKTIYLEITDKTLIGKAKAAKISDQTYNNGEEIKLSQAALILYMKSKNKPLIEGVDYVVGYENNREIGKATAVITGIGNYAGTKRLFFKIKGTAINKAVVTGIENKIYNGMEQQQNISVKVNDSVLTLGKDYIVTYYKNKDVGTANLIIQGIGAYNGKVKKSFKITSYDLGIDDQELISDLKISQGTDSGPNMDAGLTVAYTQGGCQPEVTLKFGEIELKKGKDYTVTYQNNKKIVDASAKKAPVITIKGKGNFKGKLSKRFSIVKKNLADAEYPITMSVADVVYTKGAGKYVSKPILTDVNGKKLKAGTDYETSYMAADGITKLNQKSTVNAGSYVCVIVRGKGKYEGSLMTTYRITQENFVRASIKIQPQTYTGNRIYLNGEDITAKTGKTVLIYGVDYEIVEDSYTNNIKKGTASVKIRGVNNYGGTKTVKFKIQPKRMESFSSIVKGIFTKK